MSVAVVLVASKSLADGEWAPLLVWAPVLVLFISKTIVDLRVVRTSPEGITSFSILGRKQVAWHGLYASHYAPQGLSFLHPAGYLIKTTSGMIALSETQQNLDRLLREITVHTGGSVTFDLPTSLDRWQAARPDAEFTVEPRASHSVYVIGAPVTILVVGLLVIYQRPEFVVMIPAAIGLYLWRLWRVPMSLRFHRGGIDIRYAVRKRQFAADDIHSVHTTPFGELTLVFRQGSVTISTRHHRLQVLELKRTLQELYPHITS